LSKPGRTAQAKKSGEKRKGCSVFNKARVHGVGFKKPDPRALKEIHKFPMKEMGTPDRGYRLGQVDGGSIAQVVFHENGGTYLRGYRLGQVDGGSIAQVVFHENGGTY
ncbi:hypothetical protein A6R68_01390, partial [Neotoma lepida]